MNQNYSIIFEWSERDRCFVAILPEWGQSGFAKGETYEEALENSQKAIDSLIQSSLAKGQLLPKPRVFEESLLTE